MLGTALLFNSLIYTLLSDFASSREIGSFLKSEEYKFLVEERSGISGCDLEDVSIDGSLIVEILDELVEDYKQNILEE